MSMFIGDGGPPPIAETTRALNTHGVVLDFGRHKGERLTRVPVSYLKWMVRDRTSMHDYARAELERRGTSTPAIEVSGHAIDRFSQRFLWKWTEYRTDTEKDIGLWSFLNQLAQEAWRHKHTNVSDNDEGQPEIKCTYEGINWVFAVQGEWPVVKSVM